MRFNELIMANPELAGDQNKLAQILATEWSQKLATAADLQANGGTGIVAQLPQMNGYEAKLENGKYPHLAKEVHLKNETNAGYSNGMTLSPPTEAIMIEDDPDEKPSGIPWHPSHGKPKKWMHSYLIFVKERKTTLMKNRPNLSFKEMMQFVSVCWKEIGEQDREYFNRKAELDKERYEREMNEFKTWSQQNPQLAS